MPQVPSSSGTWLLKRGGSTLDNVAWESASSLWDDLTITWDDLG